MNELTNLVDAYERLWANGAPLDLDAFLSGAGTVDTARLSRLARIDQAQRWQRGERRRAEEYLDRYPALEADADCAVDLIYHEFLLREKCAERPMLEEFTNRFPQHAQALEEQVGLHRALGHTSASGGNETFESQPAQAPTEVLRDHADRLGRYQLVAPVGVGTFGIVYKAHDSELDRTVAIKIPRAMHLASKEDVERFRREAKSVAQLRHPAIVSVHEIGPPEQTPYLVSEFVEGTTLADLLSTRRPAPREAAELLATVADALHYAHEMGVVHRDVKPANIMLDEKGAPRLMDFGLARRDGADMTMTIDGQVLGTPAYMSPEQARGESRKVDGRSDVYSLGVILYQLLTGELPFRGTTQVLLHQLLHDEPPRPRSVSHLAPRDLETICLKAMAKEPRGRYATARDMADDLRRFLRDEPIRARPVGRIERAWRWCRRKPALASLSGIVIVLLMAIALGGTAVVGILLAAIAVGGTLAAAQFRRQAQKEKKLRNEADENLYYHRIALAHRDLTASLPHPGRAEALLDACPDDRRNWEWHYLKRLWRVEPVGLRRPDSKEFRSVAFSHDGSQLAAACGDGKIRVWDQKTGEVVVLPEHRAYVYSVAFSPVDSSRLASSGNDGLVRVWDLKSRRETLSPLRGIQVYPDGMAYCVTFSPDGKWLAAASEGGTVQVWDANTGILEHSLEGHELWASSVAFSRDGRLLATGDWAGNVRIWNAQSGQSLYTLKDAENLNPLGCVAFSPDPTGQYLAACYFGRQVAVWDTATRQIHQRLPGHTGFLTGLAFHPQDARRLATTGEDRAVRLWDVPSGREVLQLKGHTDNCSGLAFSPDGRLLASASYDRTIRLWDATSLADMPRQELHSLKFDYEAWSVAISRDGRRIAATTGLGPKVEIWDTKTGLRSQTFAFGGFSVAFSPDDRRLAVASFDSDGCVVKVFDLQTSQSTPEYRETQEMFAAAFSPDGRWLALGLRDGSVKLVDAKTGEEIAFVGKHDRGIAIGGIRFRHDGLRLASASMDGTARIWDLTSALSGARGEGRSVAVSPVAQMSSGDSGIAFWSVTFSHDGRRLITGDKDGHLTLWDAETGEEFEKKSDAARGGYLSVGCSPNGRWIVSASEDCIARLYDALTLELVHSFRGHTGPIHCLAVSDEVLVTGGTDHTVKVWDLKKVDAWLDRILGP